MDSNDAVSLRHYMETMLEQYEKSHEKEHELLAQNVKQTKENLELRLESMNEFRSQINEERARMVNADRFEVIVEALNKAINEHYTLNQNRISSLEKTISNLSGRWAGITAAAGVGLIILEVILRFVVK